MEVSQRIAVSGMLASQRQLDVVSNNLANINTTGFKRAVAHTSDIGYQAGLTAPVGADGAPLRITGIGEGTQLAELSHEFVPGAVQATGNALDIAIQGNGFFSVRLADGNLGYSRDGSFSIDGTGRLVTSGGAPVQSDAGADLTVPPDSVDVRFDEYGQLTATAADGTTQAVGRLGVSRFPNDKGLQAMGQNIYTPTAASGVATAANNAVVVPGAIEGSNVDVGDEFTRLIQAQRSYQLNSKVVQAWDDVERMANELKSA